MARASSPSPRLCLPLLLLVIAAVFVALPVAACAGSSNDAAGDSTGSRRMPAPEAQKELLGEEGAPSQRREGFTLPYSCGGCTWSKTNGTLSMVGASDCGSGCPTSLFFSSSSITSVDAGAFNTTGLQHVTELTVASNQLTSLLSGIFDQLTALDNLHLGNNQLTSLPSGIFDRLTALRFLYLHNNQLTSLPSGIFDQLTALNTLWLDNNRLTSLPSGIFDQLTALYYLWLHNNQLTSLPSGIFDRLGNELTLDHADTWACSVTISVRTLLGPYDFSLNNWATFDISTYNALPPCPELTPSSSSSSSSSGSSSSSSGSSSSSSSGSSSSSSSSTGQLSVTEGLESDACVNETRTMKEISSGGREASGGFFQGGLGGKAQGDWRTYGCWRKHACLDALNVSGIDTTGDAICYKFNSAQHSWLLWGLQSSLNLQCSSD